MIGPGALDLCLSLPTIFRPTTQDISIAGLKTYNKIHENWGISQEVEVVWNQASKK